MPAPEGLDFGDDDYVDATAADTDLDLDGEQLGVSDDGTDEVVTAEPEKQYVDLDELADRYVRVGDDEVLVKDLPARVMMHKDYTQKTQELAAQRQAVAWANALQAALNEDPNGTLEVLGQAWGAQPQASETDDPRDRDIAELKSWRSQEQARTVRAQIAAEAQAVEAEHGVDFLMEASQLAQQKRWTLTEAAEVLEGRKLKAYLAAEKAKADGNAARTAAKRNDAVVTTGGSRRAVEPGPQEFNNIDDALKAALKEVSTRRR